MDYCLMAALADRQIVRRGGRSTVRLVWIVTGKARHLAGAKACGHAQAICGVCDLEAIILGGCPFEKNLIVAERFAGPVGFDIAVVAANLVRHQAAAGLEMALHADFKLTVTAEPRRVHDRLPYLFRRGSGESRADMSAARPVAPLAINPFRNVLGENRQAAVSALGI